MNYKEHIVSNEKENVFLHRTSRDLVDIIMQEGLDCGAGDLLGTATWQSRNLKSAEAMYHQNHKGNDAVIVLKIPSEIINNISKMERNSMAAKREIGYFHPTRKGFTVRPEYIAGWIDKKNDEYHSNPYENRMPVNGYEEYEFLFD